MFGRKSILVYFGTLVFALLMIENMTVQKHISITDPAQIDIFEVGNEDESFLPSLDETSTSDQKPYPPATSLENDDEQKDDDESQELIPGSPKSKKIRICTLAFNPRQGSIFRSNLLGRVGSGKYRYVVRNECPWDWPSVRLISYVKCCETLTKVTRYINAAMNTFDIIIVTGDEYCAVTDPRPHFRQYHGSQVISIARNFTVLQNWDPMKEMQEANGTRFPLFIPLGPREEFLEQRIDPNSLVAAEKRKYLYNFLGSMTSYSRQVLKRVIINDLATEENKMKYPSFVHITDKWHLKVTQSNGYIEPDEYRNILLNSVFTLCPTGHNPEAYRIYEALEAGSIPILSIDPWYERARCDQAFKPFKDAKAPFIYLNGGWKQLEKFLEKKGSNMTWVRERQKACIDWYARWMKLTALRFEAVLEHRYAKRMSRKRVEIEEDNSEELLNEKDEVEAIEREENLGNEV